MAVTKGFGTTGNGAGTVTPLDHKLAQAGLITKRGATTNQVRSGLFYDGVANIVVGTSGMSYSVQPFTAVLSRSAAAGAVLLCNDGLVNVVTTAAPGSNSRIDVVYVWQREFSLDGVDSNPVIGVVQGTPAAVPVAPSLAAFPGAIELARITVPAGVTATNSGTTIVQTAPFTAAAGGVVMFRNATERDAAVLVAGTRCQLLSDGSRFISTGSGWVIEGDGLRPVIPGSVVGGGVSFDPITGLITCTNVDAFGARIDGVFTSLYRNYLAICSVTSRSVASNTVMYLRAGGANLAAGYDLVREIRAGTVTSAQLTNNGDVPLGSGAFAFAEHRVEIFGPQQTAKKRIMSRTIEYQAAGASTITEVDGATRATAAHDGINFAPAAGTWSGTIRIYGYN